MTNHPYSTNDERPPNREYSLATTDPDDVDIRRLLFRYLRYYWLLLIFMPICLFVAWYYLRATPPEYRAHTVVLIKDEKGSGQLSEEFLLEEIGLAPTMKNLANEMLIFQSSLLMQEVVEKLQLQHTYYSEGRIQTKDLYKRSPISVVKWEPDTLISTAIINLEMGDNGTYNLVLHEKNYKGEFGRDLALPNGVINLTTLLEEGVGGNYKIELRSTEAAAIRLSNRLNVIQEGKLTAALRLSVDDLVADRAADVLNELVAAYNSTTIEEKNRVFDNTLQFIDERIALLTDELTLVEGDVQAYKQRFNMLDLTSEASLILGELSDFRRDVSETEIQLEILESIQQFLVTNRENFEFVPTNLTLTNLTLSTLLQRFNALLEERARLMATLGAEHPQLAVTKRQINNLRQTIIDNIASIKKDLIITRNAIKDNKGGVEDRLRSLPKRERELVEIVRQKEIKENLYLFLLQKREESALSLAVATPSTRVLEPARSASSPVKPNRNQIWLIALGLGIVIPFGLAYLLDLFNDKIESEDDIHAQTATPVAGVVSLSSKDKALVVSKTSRSAVAEMFRLLRANLSYIAAGDRLQTLLITSSTSGEGKSFIALNLGMTQAIAGKKALILELDLRKPKQEKYIGLVQRHPVGVANYLADPSLNPADIIASLPQHENLFLISSGLMPPNPSELILSPRLRELMDYLRENFDFIILDAPPVGLVADALQLADLVDATLYVVRQGYTHRGQLAIIDDIRQQHKLPKTFIVFNAIKIKKGRGYGYGYGYGYGHGYGYYEEEKG